MKKPICLDYLKLQSDLPEFAWKIKNILLSDRGACIVKNSPISEDNSFLLLLSSYLGEPINEPRNIDGKSVYKVEVNENLETPTYANTPFEFLCHTDCTEFDRPPDTVLLLCERQVQKGGQSYLVHIEEVLTKLSLSEIMNLSTRQFPFGNNLYPILEYEYDKPVIRYNRVPLDSVRKFYNFKFDQETLQTLDKLDSIMNEQKITFKLKPGECLIINNKTLLHGRQEFRKESDRLMKRLRLNLK